MSMPWPRNGEVRTNACPRVSPLCGLVSAPGMRTTCFESACTSPFQPVRADPLAVLTARAASALDRSTPRFVPAQRSDPRPFESAGRSPNAATAPAGLRTRHPSQGRRGRPARSAATRSPVVPGSRPHLSVPLRDCGRWDDLFTTDMLSRQRLCAVTRRATKQSLGPFAGFPALSRSFLWRPHGLHRHA